MTDVSINPERITCEVISDLMPLVKDGVASDDSKSLVMEHIAGCGECGELYREMSEEAPAPSESANDRKVISYIRRRYILFIAAIMCIGAVIGVNFTATQFQFLNILLMPIVGALSFVCLKRRGILMAAVVFALSMIRGVIWYFTYTGDSALSEAISYIPYGVIYAVLVSLGFAAAALFSYAFKGGRKNVFTKTNKAEKTVKSRLALRILAAVCGLIIIAFILFFYNEFCGNLISGTYYRIKVKNYISETYPDKDYRVSSYNYNFKNGEYWFDIIDPDSEDGCFTAGYSYYDHGVIDTYERVTNLTNTVERLERGFRAEVDPIIDKNLETKSYYRNGDYVSGEFGYATCMVDDSFYDYEQNNEYFRDLIYQDMPYDPKNMPLPTKIYLNLHGNKEEAFKRALKIAKEIRSMGYRIDYYGFATDESDGINDTAYEMIPAGLFFSAVSTDDFKDYTVRYYNNPDDAPTTTHATFSTQATAAQK